MPTMIRANVERNVPEAAVEKFKAAGYRLLTNTQEPAKTSQEGTQNASGEENITEKEKEANQGTQEGQAGNTEGQKEAEGNNKEDAAGQDAWKELPEAEMQAALEAKKVDELRKIAKNEGIQGYANMNKDTLVATIMNH